MFELLLHSVVNAWWLPILLAVGIVWWAQNSFRQFRSKIAPLMVAVRRATKVLEERTTSRDFTRDYEVITTVFADDTILGATWLEFESTLILPLHEGYVRNTRRPSEYFNDAIYYKGGVNLRDFESVPNQLVGVGLLFTFMGLVLALLIAKQGLGSDIDTAKKALGDLLNAAAFKFVTSIAALGSSVFYLSRKNHLLHEADDLIEKFCRELERLMVQVTSEFLAEESRRELVGQSAQLERFNSELAISIAEALDGKLQKSLSTAMQPIAQEIGNLAERLGEINQDALTEMVDRFSSELSGAAREHTEQMATMLQNAAASIAAVPAHIDAAGERFGERIQLGAEELTVSMTAAAENMEADLQRSVVGLASSLEVAGARSADLATAMEANATRQEALAQSVAATEEAMFARLQAILSAANFTADQLALLAEQVASAGGAMSGLSGLVTQFAAAATSLDAAISSVSQLALQTGTLNTQSQRIVEQLESRISVMARELASLNSALSSAFEKVAAGVGSFGQRTTDFVKQLDKDIADAIERLSGAVVQLDEVLGEMPKKADFTLLSNAINGLGPQSQAAE